MMACAVSGGGAKVAPGVRTGKRGCAMKEKRDRGRTAACSRPKELVHCRICVAMLPMLRMGAWGWAAGGAAGNKNQQLYLVQTEGQNCLTLWPQPRA